ncbi:MAG: GNAT family N-acetyltransferase [Pirellulaceae bacterium]|nr:GNAT family N-acetyltransferase [Pirellulaceae bacterium]
MTFTIRTMTIEDRHTVAELIYISINHWYQVHGMPAIFSGGPKVCNIFFDTYEALDPQCGIVAIDDESGSVVGSCFYHPREHHVSLGIMTVHPNHFGAGAGRGLLDWIIDLSTVQDKPVRLTQSALNVDSFSLYSKAGFVPRHAYQDMSLEIPVSGFDFACAAVDNVRSATLVDIPALVELEMHVAGISRAQDYEFLIRNDDGNWHLSVYVCPDSGKLLGFLGSCSHLATNLLGPGVSLDEETAIALLASELGRQRGRTPVFLVPVEAEKIVRAAYAWGARNCEMHFCQVLGDYKPFAGVNIPTFMPETG